jgi:ribonuclease E
VTLDNTSDNTSNAAPDQATDAPAPAKAPRRRATRTTAAPVAVDQAAAVEAPARPVDGAAQADDAGTGTAPVRTRRPAAKKAPVKRAAATRATKKVPAATGDPVPDSPAATGDTVDVPAPARANTLDVFAELASASAPRRSARSARAPSVSAERTPAENTLVENTPVENTPVENTSAGQPATPPVPARNAPLFQAADETTRPRRRRAQSPAGPPRAAEVPADTRTVPAPTAETHAESDQTVVERPAVKRTSRRRGSSRAADPVEELLDPEAPEAGPVPAAGVPDHGSDDGGAADQAGDHRSGDDQSDDDDDSDGGPRRRRRRGGRGRRGRTGTDTGTDSPDADRPDSPVEDGEATASADDPGESSEPVEDGADGDDAGSSRRRRRRRRSGRGGEGTEPEPANQPARARTTRSGGGGAAGTTGSDEVTALRGSTRLEAKRQRRREGRDAGRRRTIITESEFLARREAVDRSMVVREINGATQIAVMEDGVLVEHYVSRQAQAAMAGNVYLGRVQNVLPSMEAAFVDVGKGRNAVLYAGEVNWDAAGLEGQPRRIEQALKSGDSVLVQVTKDPIGQKGARLTSQITLAGRYLVYVPGGGMTGISRKLPDNERARLKKLLREIVPDSAGVIVRTAAEGASEDELRADIARLQEQWTAIEKKAKSASAPALLQGEPDLAIRVVRDIFNGDFGSLVVQGDEAWDTISGYIGALAPDLAQKVTRWAGDGDVFSAHRVDEQLAKGMDRKVWLPSGGSLVIDRTEAMTVVDVNTGKFTGAGGTLEETVTRNNIEAAEEIVRQLRLRDIGGIIVIDFIDMVLESNRDLVLRRLVECLGRDRTKHQVAEVTSLGLVQMTRKRVGQGLVEAFSETCEHCNGRGFIVHTDPIDKIVHAGDGAQGARGHGGTPAPVPSVDGDSKGSRRRRATTQEPLVPTGAAPLAAVPVLPEARAAVTATLATIAAAAAHAHEHGQELAAAGMAATSGAGGTGNPAHAQSGPGDLPLGPAGDEGLELFTVAPEVFAVVDGEVQPANPR